MHRKDKQISEEQGTLTNTPVHSSAVDWQSCRRQHIAESIVCMYVHNIFAINQLVDKFKVLVHSTSDVLKQTKEDSGRRFV